MNERLRKLRIRKQLSQEALARMVGIDRTMLSKIEHGSSCSIRVALGLARALGTSVEYLFGQDSDGDSGRETA